MKKKITSGILLLVFFSVSVIAATTTTFNNNSDDGLWSTASNWTAGIPTNEDTALLDSNKAATISAGETGYATYLYVGRGVYGTGSLTITGGSLYVSSEMHVGLTPGANTVAGAGTVSVVNNSYVSANVLTVGRGLNGVATNVNYDGWLIVDKTSSVSVTATLEVGRRYGKGYVVLEGDATGGATVAAATLNMSGQSGTGSVTIGTKSTLTVTTANLSLGSTIVNNGGTLSIGTLNLLGVSTIGLTGGTLNTGALALAGSTLTANSSTISLTGALTGLGSVALTDSHFTGSSIALASSTLTANSSTISLTGALTGLGSVALTDSHFTGSSITLTGTTLTADNSTISLTSALTGTGSLALTNSRLTGTSFRLNSSEMTATISGSTVVLQSTVASGVMPTTNGRTTVTNSTISIGQNGQASTGRLSLSGSVVTVSNGGALWVGSTLSLLNSTVSIDASSAQVGLSQSAVTVSAGSLLQLTNGARMTVDATGSGAIASSEVTSVSILGSVLLSGGSTLSSTGTLTVAGNGILSLTDSYVSVGTTLSQTSKGAQLNLNNSTLSVGGVFYQIYSSTVSQDQWVNSTVSLGGWEALFSDAKTNLSGTTVTLTSASAVTLASDSSTAYIYLSDASNLSVSTNSKLLVGRLYVGLSGSASTFSSTADTSTIANRLVIGSTGSSGVVTVSSGLIVMRPDNFETELRVGNGGTASLYVSGTGIINAVETMIVSDKATFSGAVYVGTLPGSPSASYVSTQTLSATSGAKFLGSVNVAADGKVSLNLSGAASSLAAITAQSLTFDSGAVVTIDFADLILSGDAQLTLLLADTVSGLNIANIVTKNLDAAYHVSYSAELIGAQQALIATLTYIPEPAVAAVLMGLVGLVAAARRRR